MWVYFLSDGISTLDSDGEFRLTIMTSAAQEETCKISKRTRRVTVWEDCLEVHPQELSLPFRLELIDELNGRRAKGSDRKRKK